MTAAKPIKHIVQLMLENRSFDQMLGFLYTAQGNRSPSGDAYAGLTGHESNPHPGHKAVKVHRIDPAGPHVYLQPGGNPGEGFFNTNLQLFSKRHVRSDERPTNRGFVANFKSAIASDKTSHYGDFIPGTKPAQIMGMYGPESLPVLSALARGYAVCDGWFASAPTQTIPNRAFAAAGTSQGRLDNHVKVFTCPSIYGRLSDRKIDWAIFGYDEPPMTRMDYPDTLYADAGHFGRFADFKKRAQAGTLPAYTFLEPGFGATGNSQHPNYDVAAGERLIHDVYRALRSGKGWNETLWILTYDEHGGNFDHVPPPHTAVPPDDTVGEFDAFDFKRYGVRLPALLISPRIKPGTVFRPKQGTLDHTSVLKTIERLWKVKPLTRRDAAAPDLSPALTLDIPRTDDPLQGVKVPVSKAKHPHPSKPSELQRVHALRVAQLPLPDEQGGYRYAAPDLTTSAAIRKYVAKRMALWDQQVLQLRKR